MADKKSVEKLLRENQLLKQVVAKQNNMQVKQVMETLELILLELDNSNGNAGQTRKAVSELIRDNGLLFKMKTINKHPLKTDTSSITGKKEKMI